MPWSAEGTKNSGPGRKCPAPETFPRRDNEFRRRGENPLAAIGYSGRGETIRVDMLRKVVIIAIGGKIGKPFLLDFATLLEQKKVEDHPLHSPEAKFRTRDGYGFQQG